MTEFSPRQITQMKRAFAEVLEQQTQPEVEPDLNFADSVVAFRINADALLSDNQRRTQARRRILNPDYQMFPSEMVVRFAMVAAFNVVAGIQNFRDDFPDRSGELTDGDEIWDFLEANPERFGTGWKQLDGNESRPTYDD